MEIIYLTGKKIHVNEFLSPQVFGGAANLPWLRLKSRLVHIAPVNGSFNPEIQIQRSQIAFLLDFLL